MGRANNYFPLTYLYDNNNIALKFRKTRLSARVSFLDTEMKIQIHVPKKLTNKVTALRMNVAAR